MRGIGTATIVLLILVTSGCGGERTTVIANVPAWTGGLAAPVPEAPAQDGFVQWSSTKTCFRAGAQSPPSREVRDLASFYRDTMPKLGYVLQYEEFNKTPLSFDCPFDISPIVASWSSVWTGRGTKVWLTICVCGSSSTTEQGSAIYLSVGFPLPTIA